MLTIWCAPPFLPRTAFCKLGIKCWGTKNGRQAGRHCTEAEMLLSAAKAELGQLSTPGSLHMWKGLPHGISVLMPLRANWAQSGQRNTDPCVLIQGGKEQILKERTHSTVNRNKKKKSRVKSRCAGLV